jgi:hypothetical protein
MKHLRAYLSDLSARRTIKRAIKVREKLNRPHQLSDAMLGLPSEESFTRTVIKLCVISALIILALIIEKY